MIRTIGYEEVIKNEKKYVMVDVRSPREFLESSIPNAINIPLFSDIEREIVGTIYKTKGVEEAKLVGLSFVSSKLTELYKQLNHISGKESPILFFCARGGMRSSSVFHLMFTLGLNVYKLDRGYKGYREYINKNLENEFKKIKFITLYGKTGTGKTKILMELKKIGCDILDLEGAANHRGSLLGSVGLSNQNTQKQFEGLIFDSIINRKSDIVFTEGESKRIGKIIMPAYMYEGINNFYKVLIHADEDIRVKYIRSDYIENVDKNHIIEGINKLSKYISKIRIDEFINNIENGEEDKVIKSLMQTYYDVNYSLKNKEFKREIKNSDEVKTAKELAKIVKEIVEETEN